MGDETTTDSDDLEVISVSKKPKLIAKSNNGTSRGNKTFQDRFPRGNADIAKQQADSSFSQESGVEWADEGVSLPLKSKTKPKTVKGKRGRKAQEAKGKAMKRKRDRIGNFSDDSIEGDDAIEHSESNDEKDKLVPGYIKERRARFQERTKTLQAGGLKLPPTYEDIEFSDDERFQDLAERPSFTDIKPIAKYKDENLPLSLGLIPASIARWLRPYQVEGAAFLHKFFVYQQGGILGDDMGMFVSRVMCSPAGKLTALGLGKTIQVIAFLTAAFGKTGDERDHKRMRKMRRARKPWYPKVLLVCPGSLLKNWQSELERWGWWHVDIFHGSGKQDSLRAAAAGNVEILITTYNTYETNKEAINNVEWDAVIADECHQIKNRHAAITKAMNEINALCRIGLTGTALQNNYDELWASG